MKSASLSLKSIMHRELRIRWRSVGGNWMKQTASGVMIANKGVDFMAAKGEGVIFATIDRM